jgi:hypothetical protein
MGCFSELWDQTDLLWGLLTNILMLTSVPRQRKRVASVIHSSVKKQEPEAVKVYSITGEKVKGKREKRIFSEKVVAVQKSTGKKKAKQPKQSKKETTHREDNKSGRKEEEQNPHFMTVADLTSGDFEQQPEDKRHETPINTFQDESSLKIHEESGQICKLTSSPGPLAANSKLTSSPSALQAESKLEDTIGKLQTKQETLDILNRTIQTRLVEASRTKLASSQRLDVYELEINFYIEKISELQKELHEKNKMISGMAERRDSFVTMVRTNRKLISENHRLKEERELLDRENAALKKLLMRSSLRKS